MKITINKCLLVINLILVFGFTTVSGQLQVTYLNCTNCTPTNHNSNTTFTYSTTSTPFNGPSKFVFSDYGARDATGDNCNYHYDWHGGIDYSTSDTSDISDAILAIKGGIISKLGQNNYKYMMIDGNDSILVNNQYANYDFGYGHFFDSPASDQRSGDFFWQHLVSNTSAFAIIINDSTALYTSSNLQVQHPITHKTITTTRTVTQGQRIGPVGTSLTATSSVPTHLHLYGFEGNNLGTSDGVTKNPLQFMSFQHRNYALSFFIINTQFDGGHSHTGNCATSHYSPNAWPRFFYHGAGFNLVYPGTKSSQILVKVDQQDSIATSAETYKNGVLSIEKEEVFIRYENQDSSLIKGPVFESKVIYNGKINANPNDSPYPSDLVTRGQAQDSKTGIQPWAYSGSNGRSGSFDYFNFANFKTRIHKNDPGNWQAADSLMFKYAYCPQDARYNDGNYTLKAKVTDIIDSCSYSSPFPFVLDNYKPFIMSVSASIGTKVIYGEEWRSMDTCIAITQHHLYEKVKTDSLKLGMTILAKGSEPLSNLLLNVPALQVSNKPPVDTSFINGFYFYKFRIDTISLDTGSFDVTFKFAGNDASGNPLIAFNTSHIGSCIKVPIRISSNAWQPTNLPFGTDTIHHFSFECGSNKSQRTVLDETIVSLIDDEININYQKEDPAFCEEGSITLNISGGVPPYVINWSHDPSAHSTHLEGLPDGQYCVTVTDILCGVEVKCITLQGSDMPFAISEFGNPTRCADEYGHGYSCDGFINISYLPGFNQDQFPFEYSWSGPNQFNSQDQNIDHLCVGEYKLTITTAGGCKYYIQKTLCCCLAIGEPPSTGCENIEGEFEFLGEVTNAHDQYSDDGSIDITVFNSANEPSFTWYNSTYGYFSFSEDVSSLEPGEYYLTISDGCLIDSAVYFIGYDSCYGPGNLAIIHEEVHNIFPGDPAPYPGSLGSVLLQITTDDPPHYTEWFKYIDINDPWPQQINVTSDSLLNWPPGMYQVRISDLSGCQLLKNYEIKECNGSVGFDLDFSKSAYCWSGNDGEIGVDVTIGYPPYKAFLYKGQLSPSALIQIDELTTNNNSFSLDGIYEPGVYYVQIYDSHGNCGSRIQYIPCTCDLFRASLFQHDECMNQWFTPSEIVFDEIYKYGTLSQYESLHLNSDDLLFKIIWEGDITLPGDSDTTLATLNGIVSGPEDYHVTHEGTYQVVMKDPFGCVKLYTFYFGSPSTCIASGGDQLEDILLNFYGDSILPYPVDNFFIEVGCFPCDYCGEDTKYCGQICYGYLSEQDGYEDNTYVSLVPEDLQNPCATLSFYCPMSPEDTLVVEPGDFYTEFINWNADTIKSGGNCYLPCGCLYPANTFEYQPNPRWVETYIQIPGENCIDTRPDPDPDPDNACEPCRVEGTPRPIFGAPDECLQEYICLDPPCRTIVRAPVSYCCYRIGGVNIEVTICDHTGEPIAYEYIEECQYQNNPEYYCEPRYQIFHFIDSSLNARNLELFGNSANSQSPRMSIYPNPTTGELYFDIIGINEGFFNLQITDVLSNTLISQRIEAIDSKAGGSLDLQNLSSGMYIISIRTNTQSNSKVFIKI